MTALYELGAEVIGPAFFRFVGEVIARAEERKCDRVWFVAREGWLFQRLYELACDREKRPRLPSSYLHLSRLSTSVASIDGYGAREIQMGLAKGEERSARAMLAAFELWTPEIEARARAAGFGDCEQPIGDWRRDQRIARFTADGEFQRLCAERAAKARALLLRHLAEAHALDGRRPLLVDVGWSGTIQNNLARAFAREPKFASPYGMYFALVDRRRRLPGNDDPDDDKEGVIADGRRDRGLPASSVFHFLELFEEAARADHGTTLGYREQAGRVEPILREAGPDREAEKRAQPARAELQRGILACAAEARPLKSVGELQRRLERLIFAPSSRELEAIAELVHADDWGAASHRRLVTGEGPGALLRPSAWLRGFQRSAWKPAFVARTGGALAARMYHGYVRLKEKIAR